MHRLSWPILCGALSGCELADAQREPIAAPSVDAALGPDADTFPSEDRRASAAAAIPQEPRLGGRDSSTDDALAPDSTTQFDAASRERDATEPEPDAGAPKPPPEFEVLNGCEESSFLDRRAESADRTLAWTYGFGLDPERCLMIRPGQSVQFDGNLSSHPVQSHGGHSPSPIMTIDSSGIVAFPEKGLFGYECGYLHSQMSGAIWVVP